MSGRPTESKSAWSKNAGAGAPPGGDEDRSQDLLDNPLTSPREIRGAPLPDAEVLGPDGGFWVFAYGSLLWNPGFAFVEKRPAVLPGYRRSFCLWSVHYRGTPERPGLVVALDEDAAASTTGVAYRVGPEAAAETRAYLIRRELLSASYHERVVPLRAKPGLRAAPMGGPGSLSAVTYVIDRAHEQYAGRLSLDEQAQIIAESCGPAGANCEYLFNTVSHLREIGLTDEEIGDLATLDDAVRRRVRS